LKSLARRTGTTYAYPRTSADASREIRRLLALDSQTVPDGFSQAPADAYATAPAPGEIVGYGADASWYRSGEVRPTDAQLSFIARLERQCAMRCEPPQSFDDALLLIDRLIERRSARGTRRRPSRETSSPGDAPSEAASQVDRPVPAAGSEESRRARHLAHYSRADTGEPRQIVAVTLECDATLVIDRQRFSRSDARLLARIPQDEPSTNATLVAKLYLADETRGRCRLLVSSDFASPLGAVQLPAAAQSDVDEPLRDADARCYAIHQLKSAPDASELRWVCGEGSAAEQLTVREVVGRLERYEVVCQITSAVIAKRVDSDCSTTRLAAELDCLRSSPHVLNRGVREAVNRAVERGDTLSAIAQRCGRFTEGPRGQVKSDASWVARKIGQAPETTGGVVSPWLHTDTLALIARDGLSCDPREVEVA
jgi:hypothetical protein